MPTLKGTGGSISTSSFYKWEKVRFNYQQKVTFVFYNVTIPIMNPSHCLLWKMMGSHMCCWKTIHTFRNESRNLKLSVENLLNTEKKTACNIGNIEEVLKKRQFGNLKSPISLISIETLLVKKLRIRFIFPYWFFFIVLLLLMYPPLV